MVTIRKVLISDADTLLAFSKKTFYDFFAHLNEPVHMEAYSSVQFTIENTERQLIDPNSRFYFALLDSEVIGYLKVNFDDAQTEFRDKDALEVERIYVEAGHHGKHIGKQLLNFAIDIAAGKQFNYVWLGVWEHNDKAIAFYERNGFKVFGSHEFLLGEDKQTDLLMRRAILPLNDGAIQYPCG